MTARLGLALLGAVCAGIWAVWPTARRLEPLTAASVAELSVVAASPVRVAPSPRPASSLPPSAAAPAVPAAVSESPAAPPKSSAELEAEYAARFAADALDTRATRQTSTRLADALQARELAGSSLQGVSCGRSLCRMEIQHEDAAAKQRFVDAFPTAVPWQTTGLIRFVDEHASVVYLEVPAP